MRILLTGASGYIGGRLLPLLHQDGHQLRVLARRPEFLAGRLPDGVELVQGDVLDEDSLRTALEGCELLCYLVHSMGAGSRFAEQDRRAAECVTRAAAAAGLRHIIYLGGLADEEHARSAHMASRLEVGRILLRSGPVPVTEFRASIIIGSGSLSFELVRALAEKLPVMVTPSWVKVQAQPIGIRDLLAYLREAAGQLPTQHRVVEGGSEVLSYGDLVLAYAGIRGLKRRLLPVPFLSPRLSSLWLGLVTPLYARVGRWLIDSIRHPSVVRHPEAAREFAVRPVGAREAIRRALEREESGFAETRWSDALSSSGLKQQPWGGLRQGSRLVDARRVAVPVPPVQAFQPIHDIGGPQGWYAWNLLWQLRGMLDLLVGGVGMRRGRPRGRQLRAGDPLDFWRVERIEVPHRLRLVAEMKVPGRAWLEFEVTPEAEGCVIHQTAVFHPSGLAGLLYWYGVWPLHALVFRDMIRALARRAESGNQAR